ncbi:hypothetical protein [Phycicoccus avicenniae]|uniref:hypothetical protein n=1 Tax=Phycicoccus avicenniae TaxID=2828860 RepID=UPI003D2D2EC1
MRALRFVLGTVGVGVAAYGLLRLVRLPSEQLPSVLVWVVGGIVAHDGLLAPLVVGLGVAAAASARWVRGPLLAAVVVLGPLTLVAVPVLGRFGARADNTTLLDRPYLAGYLALVGGVVALAVVSAVRSRRARSGLPTPEPRR